MLPQSHMKAVLKAYVDGLNAGDADAVIALFSPDAVIEDPIGTPEKRGAEIETWFRAAAKMHARLELATPIRGSHGNAAAMAFTVTTRFEGQIRTTRSLDTMRFDEHGRITRLEAYWGPDDVETRPA